MAQVSLVKKLCRWQLQLSPTFQMLPYFYKPSEVYWAELDVRMIAGCLFNWLLSVDKPAGVRICGLLVVISLPKLSFGTPVISSPGLRGFSKAGSCYSVKLRSKINGCFLVGPRTDLIGAAKQREVVYRVCACVFLSRAWISAKGYSRVIYCSRDRETHTGL